MKKTWMRWLPAAIVPVVVVAGAIAIPAAADAAPKLPEKSAQQVLEMIGDSVDARYTGTIEQSSDLGLPELPSTGQTSDTSTALELLTGSHTAQVQVGGADTARLQVMDSLAERDVIRNGNDVWLYGSRKNEATHFTLPERADAPAPGAVPTPGAVSTPGAVPTPAALAATLLATVDSSTSVTVGENSRVAKRTAYELVFTPKTNNTLIGEVSLAVDSETGLPLSFAVTAAGQTDPAFSVAFSAIDFTAPPASAFAFVPPVGATVTEMPVAEENAPHPAHSPASDPVSGSASDSAETPSVIGEGWSTIVALPSMSAPDDPAAGFRKGSADDSAALLDQVLTPVDGGRVLQTALVSVFLTDDGRMFVGAVSAEQLRDAAAE